jgi:hypothetical protein
MVKSLGIIRSKLLQYMYIFQAELRTGIIFLLQIANPLEICEIKHHPHLVLVCGQFVVGWQYLISVL